MASQYDDIGSKYNNLKVLPPSIMEQVNLKESVQPWLDRFPNARVLDLACGAGFYSKKMLDWGAGYVLGVDQSDNMAKAAEELLHTDKSYTGRARFRVGNALDLGQIADEGPFHIAIGIWLLNYASNLEDMTRMYRSISANLREGGVFIAVTPPPAEDVDARAESWEKIMAPYLAELPVRVDYYEKLESGQGWKTEIKSLTEGAQFSFRNFHLRKSAYEEAARRGGLTGKLQWKELHIPEQVATAGDAFRTMCVELKHMGILTVEK